MISLPTTTNYATTRNACNLCTPLGACLVFRGIQGAIPYLHGSQGCATYIRRYLIGHFREPMDIASSNFSESSAIYGGADNFRIGLTNVIRQYKPELVGIATTCLSETIGEDIPMYLHEFHKSYSDAKKPELVHVSTPSYQGTHADGFHATVRAVAEKLAESGPKIAAVNLMPGQVSPADLRHLREICHDFELEPICLPDYSDTLDGPSWDDYQRIPAGGTPIQKLRQMGQAQGSIEFALVYPQKKTAGSYLEKTFAVPRFGMSLPLGITAADQLLAALETISGKSTPEKYEAERGRLIDSYVDAHKYISGKRVVLFGDEDLIIGLGGFLAEIGLKLVLCASGGESGRLREMIGQVTGDSCDNLIVLQDTDFATIEETAQSLQPDLLIGGSKGYSMARSLGVPLLRVGFPIHDRIGAARQLHVGYRGTQHLFDQLVNTLIASQQDKNPVGYMNM